jgi:hypothetical protein
MDCRKSNTEYYMEGIQDCKRDVLKLIRKLGKEYDKSIDMKHLVSEIKEMRVRVTLERMGMKK